MHSVWGIPLCISSFTDAYSWVVKNPTCLLAIGWGPIWYASQLIYLILLSGQVSVEFRSELFQLIGIYLLQFPFACLKLRTHSRYHRFAKRVGKITRARNLFYEADFIALRSQLTLPTKPTSSPDEVNSIFEGDVYTFFRLLLRMV